MSKLHNWELIISDIDNEGGTSTRRLKVYGGWMVMHLCWWNESGVQSESSIFVPDPNHEWSLE